MKGWGRVYQIPGSKILGTCSAVVREGLMYSMVQQNGFRHRGDQGGKQRGTARAAYWRSIYCQYRHDGSILEMVESTSRLNSVFTQTQNNYIPGYVSQNVIPSNGKPHK